VAGTPPTRDTAKEVREYLETYGKPDREALATELGYASWSSLERVLYRKGAHDLVHQMMPERRSREKVLQEANPIIQAKYRRSTYAKVRTAG
jgi:hypothetical protein